MKTAIGRTQHAANWITVALLTLCVMGFGVFANSRVNAQVSNGVDAIAEQTQFVRLPMICSELKDGQRPGRIHAVLTEVACQSEDGEVAGLINNLTNRIMQSETSGS